MRNQRKHLGEDVQSLLDFYLVQKQLERVYRHVDSVFMLRQSKHIQRLLNQRLFQYFGALEVRVQVFIQQ